MANGPLDGVLRYLRAVLALGLLGAGAGVLTYHAQTGGSLPPATAAPLPGVTGHAFRPVDKAWVKTGSYLKPDGGDPPESYTVVEPKDRDPAFKGYYREERYRETAQAKEDCKILRYHPSGYLHTEIDNLGKEEQFSRSLRADGSVAYFAHWRGGQWLDGYSVSPGGKVWHRLRDGRGELVVYGDKDGFYRHTWYHEGYPFLEKRFEKGACSGVRLNGGGSDSLTVSAKGERLLLWARQEIWYKAPGEKPHFQEIGRPDPRRAEAGEKLRELYPLRRQEFLETYGKFLRKAGRSWQGLGIDFIRSGKPWPG
jgi:hypothetical protein